LFPLPVQVLDDLTSWWWMYGLRKAVEVASGLAWLPSKFQIFKLPSITSIFDIYRTLNVGKKINYTSCL
jgi:hypothetical protein